MNLQALAVAAVLCLVAGGLLDRCAPIVGAQAQAERIKADRDQWKSAATSWERAADGWKASFRKAEDLRAQEARQANAALSEVSAACELRIAKARQSAAAIAALVTQEPKRDQNGCVVRALLDPRELRDALNPAG
jgi:hypothetical protein